MLFIHSISSTFSVFQMNYHLVIPRMHLTYNTLIMIPKVERMRVKYEIQQPTTLVKTLGTLTQQLIKMMHFPYPHPLVQC